MLSSGLNFSSFFTIILVIFALVQDINAKPPRKIVGGDDATIEEFPSIVSLRKRNKHYCGGSLISNRHVLTAAHCAVKHFDWSETYAFRLPPKIITVHVGTNSSNKYENAHAVQKVHVHDLYTGSEASRWSHDIAILTLKDPIVPSKSQKPITLVSEEPEDGDVGQIVGWGVESADSKVASATLKKAFMEVVDNEVCQYLTLKRVPDTQLCAYNGYGTGFCDGDSGGPFIVNNKLVGIISHSIGCAEGLPDMYTRVHSYRTWIQNILDIEK